MRYTGLIRSMLRHRGWLQKVQRMEGLVYIFMRRSFSLKNVSTCKKVLQLRRGDFKKIFPYWTRFKLNRSASSQPFILLPFRGMYFLRQLREHLHNLLMLMFCYFHGRIATNRQLTWKCCVSQPCLAFNRFSPRLSIRICINQINYISNMHKIW